MEKILDASGYHFHVLTIEGQRYWIGKEIINAFGFRKRGGSMNMFRNSMDKEDVHTIRLDKDNGLIELKNILLEEVCGFNPHTLWTERNIKQTAFLALVREDTLQKYLTLYTRKPDAKEVGKKLYKYFTKPVEKKENALQQLLRSEVEALELGSRFRKWYTGHVDSITFLFLLTIKSTSIQFAEGKDSSSYINNSCLV